jgi:hypothetical protein
MESKYQLFLQLANFHIDYRYRVLTRLSGCFDVGMSFDMHSC